MMVTSVNDFYQDLPRLETARLVLRKATRDDVADMFTYSSDADVTRYLRWGPHQTIRDTERYLEEVLLQYSQGKDGPWLIEYKDQHTVIGHIHLMEIEVQHQKAKVGFVLAKCYWTQGFMTEALKKILEYSFTSLGLNRLEGWCVSENRAAQRVMAKCGMVKEGDLREYVFQKNAFLDFCVYALLRKDFEK